MHYGGNLSRMTELLELCTSRGITLIEDSCHAVGARYHEFLSPDEPANVNPHLHNVPLQIAAERGIADTDAGADCGGDAGAFGVAALGALRVHRVALGLDRNRVVAGAGDRTVRAAARGGTPSCRRAAKPPRRRRSAGRGRGSRNRSPAAA